MTVAERYIRGLCRGKLQRVAGMIHDALVDKLEAINGLSDEDAAAWLANRSLNFHMAEDAKALATSGGPWLEYPMGKEFIEKHTWTEEKKREWYDKMHAYALKILKENP